MLAVTAPLSAPTSALAGRTILQIIPQLDTGGAERTAIDVAAALAECGSRALVATEGGRLVSELQAKGGIWTPFPAKTKNPFAMAVNAIRLARLIEREGVDLVHARSRAPAWVAYMATRIARRPFVTTYHGSYSGTSSLKLSYNSVMARGDIVIANSDYTAANVARLYPFAQDRIRVINRGTDFRAFSPAAVETARVQKLRRAWGVGPEDRIVLQAARLTHWKGQLVLIEAARILAVRGLTDVRFILAGDDQGRSRYSADLKAAIAQAGLGEVVRLTGHCTDMPAALMAASVVAVPSTLPEAFGRVAVEAQAMGAPVVVSDLGAVPETVLAPPQVAPAARTGWHVPAGNAAALADALQAALEMGASARDAMAARARVHVRDQFSLERMCAETLDVYAALIEAGPVT
jgi:glycosyltransferase involved in cell wall biosynthesis